MLGLFDFILEMIDGLTTSLLGFSIAGQSFTYGHLLIAACILGVMIRLLLGHVRGGRL